MFELEQRQYCFAQKIAMEVVRKLFGLGLEMGKGGYPWYKSPPEIGDLEDD